MRITQKKIAQWITEGRGQGHGHDYLPWLLIRRGQSPTGGSLQYRYVPQFDRYFHLMSKAELRVARFLLWLGVLDLRDQFPCWPWPHPHPLYLHPDYHPQVLPWSEGTLVCAKDLGIRHPVYPGTRIPYVPTFDMLATTSSREDVRAVAIAVKPEETEVSLTCEDLEKLAIQKEYSLRLNFPWKLMSGTMIPPILSSNLLILIHYSGQLEVSLSYQWDRFIEVLNASISPNLTMNETLRAVEAETKLPCHIVRDLFHKALWFRKTNIDLRQPIVMTIPPMLAEPSWIQPTFDYVFGEQT